MKRFSAMRQWAAAGAWTGAETGAEYASDSGAASAPMMAARPCARQLTVYQFGASPNGEAMKSEPSENPPPAPNGSFIIGAVLKFVLNVWPGA